MRILIASTLLIATASCAWPPPPAQVAAAPPAAAAVPAPLPPPVALMAPPPAVMPAPPPVAVAVAAPPPPPPPAPVVFAPLAGLFGPPPSGRLTLSNFSFDTARIETVITGAPDCAAREGTTTSDFVLPLNGTRVIQSVPGADVCWRRAIEAGKNAGVRIAE